MTGRIVAAVVWACLTAAGASVPRAQAHLPAYTRQVLQNGLLLDIVPVHEVPLVTIRVLVRGGAESEPLDKAGLARVTADALRRGTAKRIAPQFSSELDTLGAQYAVNADLQSSSVQIEVLAKDLDKGLDLLLEALTAPSFPEAEMTKLLAQSIDSLKLSRDRPAFAAGEYFRSFYFGPNHPYGHPADDVSLGRIRREDIANYHRDMYVGRNMMVVVAGDVDPGAVERKLAKAFGAIREGTAYMWKSTPKQRETSARRLAVVDKPDATETQFRIGLPGIERTDPDRFVLLLVNTLFGGRFTSVLNDALRVNSGLTYGASSIVDKSHLPGRITIATFTSTANTVKAVDMALDVLTRFSTEGITQAQLDSARAYVKGTYPVDHLETADQIADVLGDIELFDLNRSEVDDLFARFDAITLQQANAAIRKHYTPDKLAFLLFGNVSQFPSDYRKYSSSVITTSVNSPGYQFPSVK